MIKILLIDHSKTFFSQSFEKLEDFETDILYNSLANSNFSFIEKVFNKLRIPIDLNLFNQRILDKVKAFCPDLIIVAGQTSNNYIFPSTLVKIKKKHKTKIFSWTPDNMIKKHNSSVFFERSIGIYDIHFTTKSIIIDKLYKKGAKKVVYLNQAYSKYDHFPEPYNKDYDFDVLFIGSGEKERYLSLCFLAKKGIRVNVFGGIWGKFSSIPNLIIHRKPLTGKKYRQAITSSKINLCFLRKINNDIHTARSIEIPSCNGFMIAERTKEHIELFEENLEAVYFSSNEELFEKVNYYLRNETERKRIANNSYKKVINFNLSYDDVLKKIISNF